jgi:hypothetical protein
VDDMSGGFSFRFHVVDESEGLENLSELENWSEELGSSSFVVTTSKRSSRSLATQFLRQVVQFLHITVFQKRLEIVSAVPCSYFTTYSPKS